MYAESTRGIKYTESNDEKEYTKYKTGGHATRTRYIALIDRNVAIFLFWYFFCYIYMDIDSIVDAMMVFCRRRGTTRHCIYVPKALLVDAVHTRKFQERRDEAAECHWAGWFAFCCRTASVYLWCLLYKNVLVDLCIYISGVVPRVVHTRARMLVMQSRYSTPPSEPLITVTKFQV